MTFATMMKHPLPLETKILSVEVEQDDDDDGRSRKTGRNAVGEVLSADYYPSQGWTYGVAFTNGVWVFLDEAGGLDGETKYRLV